MLGIDVSHKRPDFFWAFPTKTPRRTAKYNNGISFALGRSDDGETQVTPTHPKYPLDFYQVLQGNDRLLPRIWEITLQGVEAESGGAVELVIPEGPKKRSEGGRRRRDEAPASGEDVAGRLFCGGLSLLERTGSCLISGPLMLAGRWASARPVTGQSHSHSEGSQGQAGSVRGPVSLCRCWLAAPAQHSTASFFSSQLLSRPPPASLLHSSRYLHGSFSHHSLSLVIPLATLDSYALLPVLTSFPSHLSPSNRRISCCISQSFF